MNENLYQDELNNSVRISEFSAFSGETKFSNMAAKFVVSGKENYFVNGKKFVVNQGEYIIGNNERLTEVLIEEQTVGICLDISNELLGEIIDEKFVHPGFKEFIFTDDFLINKYKAQHTHLGHTFQQLSKSIINAQTDRLLKLEMFYSIGESIVNDQSLVHEQLIKLNYKKQEVNEEVLRNLLRVKAFMDDSFLDKISIDDLTRIALSSRYAFIRLFKHTFGLTPYQYLLQKRLIFAKGLLLNNEKAADVALKTGFADLPSFSKAFKGFFGVSPSKVCE